MLNTLNALADAVEQTYAPKEWKKTFAGWDLDAEV